MGSEKNGLVEEAEIEGRNRVRLGWVGEGESRMGTNWKMKTKRKIYMYIY